MVDTSISLDLLLSLVARPGTSYPPPPTESTQQKAQLVQPDISCQQTGSPAIEPHGLTTPGIPTSDGFDSQANNDDFSDFQEAQVPFSSQSTSVSTNQNTGWSLQPGNQSMPGQPGIAWQSYSGTNTSVSSVYGSPTVNQVCNGHSVRTCALT